MPKGQKSLPASTVAAGGRSTTWSWCDAASDTARSARQLSDGGPGPERIARAVPAALGLELRWGGYDCRVSAIEANGVCVEIGSSTMRIPLGSSVVVDGIAWDGGAGIRDVEVSLDEGHSWESATLAPSLGRYSFRAWRYAFTPRTKGRRVVMARASSLQGSTQTLELVFNASGYHNNAVQRVALEVV